MFATTRLLLSVGLAISTGALACADDMTGSNMVESFDNPFAGGAEGPLVSNDSDATPGINPDLANPVLTHPIVLDNWSFEVMHHVGNYPDTDLDGLSDGAGGVRLGVRGWHLVGPHTDDDPTNELPLIWSSPSWIPWNRVSNRAVSSAIAHPGAGHEDWYGASSLLTAYDADPANGLARRIGDVDANRMSTIVAARHEGAGHTTFNWNTLGRPMPTVYFDPATGILHFPMILIDPFAVVDFDGGRSGTIDPAYADDPIMGSVIAPIDLHLAGYDEQAAEYIFSDGIFDLVNPDESISIRGTIDNFRVSVNPENPKAYGSFSLLEVLDTNEPGDGPPNWAEQFVRTGWFGEGLDEADRGAIEKPVLALLTDLDLVAATEGFTRPAEFPATILLTILTGVDPDCPIDFNHDGLLDFFDVQIFLGLFADGDPAADLNSDGDLDFFDVLGFLEVFSSNCM